MFKGDYEWQHNYERLAFDTGFCFEKHQSDNFDKNKISSVDIDRIIQERDFATIEKFIPSVTKFVLDPEQAEILDTSFVKTFQLGQLSIQYLLFCKKYLDNSLILAKQEITTVKEENKELNLFVDDLQGHISNLIKEIDHNKAAFKCSQCNKIFSSEEFLSSHIKRRHALVEAETDKLQMEIKELKGRLNNAEKMIQKEHTEIDTNISELKKIDDLKQKFEDLRVQVQSELKVLQTQHNFQEKYERLFEKITLQGGSKLDKRGARDLCFRRESTTQTDLETEAGVSSFEEKDKENVPEFGNANKQMTELGAALETKVTSSLEKIENQMQSFWNKLSEMEKYKKKDDGQEENRKSKSRKKILDLEDNETTLDTESSLKHSIKNKKENLEKEEFSPKVDNTETTRDTESSLKQVVKNKKEEFSPKQDTSKDKKLTKASNMMAAEPQKELVKKAEKIESEISVTHPTDDETTTSETIASETEITVDSPEEEPIKPLPVPRKRPPSSLPKKSTDVNVIDEELLKHFRVVVEKIIMGRLQDLGVSPDWKGLPTRSFQRALEIVNHQATLMKKTYPNFDSISAQLEKRVSKKIEDDRSPQKLVKSKPKKITALVSTRGKIPSPRLEIKNRKMYDTDSESEVKPVPIKGNLVQFSAPYSAVIAELKSVTSKIDASDKSEVNSVKEENVRKNEDQTKGVLKSYPSVGSLTKKKVLFNLEDKKPVKDGGSTTSITSSVLDGSPRKEEKKKDIEDLSDFDFSDM